MVGNVPFGCGQCLPCRINRRRVWTWRQFLESLVHEENCFVTLTYDDAHLPPDGSLRPKDVTDWLKRVRKALDPTKFRYFLAGEYGDQTFRPHYHLSMFGIGQAHQYMLAKAWPHGFISVCEFNETTAQYVAGYVVKKMTDKGDPRLQGRYPEYSRMSNRPGIGADAMKIIADQMWTLAGQEEMQKTGDVPMKLMLGKRSIPLGRYLRRKLREEVGLSDEMVEATKHRFSLEKSVQVSALLEAALKDRPLTYAKAEIIKENLGKLRNIEGRSKLKPKRGTL